MAEHNAPDTTLEHSEEVLKFGRGHARMNPTEAALMRRGIDNVLASKLRKLGHTLATLKASSDAALGEMGISDTQIKQLRQGSRTDIPFDNLARLLWANRWTCCVCRCSGLAVIVHHIKPWATSHDHEIENLAVLCLEHHAMAHRRGDLEQNLGERQLREAKARWETEVCTLDPKAILDASRIGGHHWWWFNHVRVLEMAATMGIELTHSPHFPSAYRRGYIDRDGRLSATSETSRYLYVGGDGICLYGYVRDIVEAVIGRLAIFNISDDLDPGFLRSVVSHGDFLLVQGKHYFKKLCLSDAGPGQSSEARREANRVRVSFVVDRWEAVTNSSWHGWLVGTQTASSVVRVSSIDQDGGRLHLRCTGFAVGSPLRGLSTREYAYPTWPQPAEEDVDDGWLTDFGDEPYSP